MKHGISNVVGVYYCVCCHKRERVRCRDTSPTDPALTEQALQQQGWRCLASVWSESAQMHLECMHICPSCPVPSRELVAEWYLCVAQRTDVRIEAPAPRAA